MVCCKNEINIVMHCKTCGKRLSFEECMEVVKNSAEFMRDMRLPN